MLFFIKLPKNEIAPRLIAGLLNWIFNYYLKHFKTQNIFKYDFHLYAYHLAIIILLYFYLLKISFHADSQIFHYVYLKI